jgi:hypothetical protein
MLRCILTLRNTLPSNAKHNKQIANEARRLQLSYSTYDRREAHLSEDLFSMLTAEMQECD